MENETICSSKSNIKLHTKPEIKEILFILGHTQLKSREKQIHMPKDKSGGEGRMERGENIAFIISVSRILPL